DERSYKIEIGHRLRATAEAVLRGAPAAEWEPLLRRALGPPNNITGWRVNDAVLKWCTAEPAAAAEALRAIWDPQTADTENVRGFLERLPGEIVRGAGTRACLASLLLTADGAEQHPIYKPTPYSQAFKLTGYPPPASDATAAEVFAHAVGFLDRLTEEAAARNLELRDPLDAQS